MFAAPPSLPTELISLTSYIVSHASVTTHRARLYSRLCLIILLILVEEGEAKLSVAREEGEIRVCRQVSLSASCQLQTVPSGRSR